MPKIESLDHLVLTVADMPATVAFYRDVLGMQAEEFRPADGSVRTALMFGEQKINLHDARAPFDPKAKAANLSRIGLPSWAIGLKKAPSHARVQRGRYCRSIYVIPMAI